VEKLPYSTLTESPRTLHFYQEIYAPHKHEEGRKYMVKCGIYPGGQVSDTIMPLYLKQRRLPDKGLEAFFISFNLSELKSGMYHYKAEIFNDKKIKEAESHIVFANINQAIDLLSVDDYQRYMEKSFVNDMDSARVRYSLMALVPVIPENLSESLNTIINTGRADAQRFFLHQYWHEIAPGAPKESYLAYMKVAEMVDTEFYDTVGRGFQTDRGYIFLKYGQPSKIISIDDEPNTPPYQIWYYDAMEKTGQANVRFIFYSPSLVPNNFELLHSTCYGERRDPGWELKLYKNSPQDIQGGQGIDATEMGDAWMRRARKLFNDF
jgi:GWxTD domain-containing protein